MTICVLFQTYSHDDVIIMELCTGGSLCKILNQPDNYYGLGETEFMLVLKHISKVYWSNTSLKSQFIGCHKHISNIYCRSQYFRSTKNSQIYRDTHVYICDTKFLRMAAGDKKMQIRIMQKDIRAICYGVSE